MKYLTLEMPVIDERGFSVKRMECLELDEIRGVEQWLKLTRFPQMEGWWESLRMANELGLDRN